MYFRQWNTWCTSHFDYVRGANWSCCLLWQWLGMLWSWGFVFPVSAAVAGQLAPPRTGLVWSLRRRTYVMSIFLFFYHSVIDLTLLLKKSFRSTLPYCWDGSVMSSENRFIIILLFEPYSIKGTVWQVWRSLSIFSCSGFLGMAGYVRTDVYVLKR
jgi:hypothetical protein